MNYKILIRRINADFPAALFTYTADRRGVWTDHSLREESPEIIIENDFYIISICPPRRTLFFVEKSEEDALENFLCCWLRRLFTSDRHRRIEH
jgi:hypothetical protein